MKILKTIIAALALSLPVSTDAFAMNTTAYEETETTEPTHFILCLKDGEQVMFLLKHAPKVVNGENTIMVVDAEVTFEYPLTNVHKYLMGVDEATGIDNIPYSKDGITGDISNCAGNIILSGFKAGESVSITNINGVNISRVKTNADGCLTIATSQYPSGIYIVKVQNQTFKFIKR